MHETGEVKRHRAPNAVTIKNIHHPPKTHARTIVAQAVTENVGMGHARPGIARVSSRWQIFEIFDIRHNPKCQPRAARPCQPGSIPKDRIYEPIRFHSAITLVRGASQHWTSHIYRRLAIYKVVSKRPFSGE